jgi:hypothetical protein
MALESLRRHSLHLEEIPKSPFLLGKFTIFIG